MIRRRNTVAGLAVTLALTLGLTLGLAPGLAPGLASPAGAAPGHIAQDAWDLYAFFDTYTECYDTGVQGLNGSWIDFYCDFQAGQATLWVLTAGRDA